MAKRIRKIAGAVVLALAIGLTQIPAPLAFATSPSDFERDQNTIVAYNGTATTVSIPNGVTRIDSEAFSNQNQLTKVTFPASLEEIGNGAFRSCTSITDVSLPGNVTTLESGAFAKCDNLKSFKFSNTLVDMGAGVFSGDSKLTTLDLNKNPYFVFKDGALYDKDMKVLYCVLSGRVGNSFTIPESVNRIERYAFWGCNNLTNVNLSSNLTEIPEFAFSNCENLEEITVPLSVRRIGAKAFEDCISLGNVRIPASVTYIHDTAFDGCRNLNIISDVGTTAYEFFRAFDLSQSALMEYEDSVSENAIGSYFPKDSVTRKEKKKTTEPAKTSSKVLPQKFDPGRKADMSKADVWDDYTDATGEIGKTRVVGNEAVIFPGTFDNATKAQEGGAVEEMDTSNPARLPIEEYPTPTQRARNKEGVIPRRAYYAQSNPSDVEVEEGTTAIGDLAFARSSLKSVILPDGLKSIGYGAFYHCDDLEMVRIPDSVTDISPEAFAETPFLDNWLNKQGDPFWIVGDGVLMAYRGSGATVTIPDTVKKIAGSAFAGHGEIQSVRLPASLTEIGEGAFYDCTGLSSVTGGSGLKKIADRAFLNCPVDKLHIPATVEQIGLGAFAGAVSPSVVFESDTIPALSYEQTSTRLTNDAFRIRAMGEIPTAVVTGNGISLKDSVLDENYLGFRGLIVNVPNGLSDSKREAVLVKSTMAPDMFGTVRIPETVTIDGNPYKLVGALPSAFSSYDPAQGQAAAQTESGENPMQSAKISGVKTVLMPSALGTIGDYVEALAVDPSTVTIEEPEKVVYEVEDEKEEDKKDKKNKKKKGEEEEAPSYVTTVALDNSFPNAALIKANVKDDDAPYTLFVSKDDKDAEKLLGEVTKEYGLPVSGQLVPFELRMVENATNVPITNFGKRPVEIKVPISDTLYDQQILAVSLKEDGTLDKHYGTKSEEDGQKYFTFTTTHFSPYGIYAGIGEVAEEIAKKTAEMHNKDESPDTGDHSIPLQIVIAIFLGAFGLLLLLYKKEAK